MWRLFFLACGLLSSAVAQATAPTLDTSYQVQMTPLRQQLTLEYIQQHYDPKATSINITPRIIVIHWTATNSLKSTLATFGPDELAGRADIQRGGKLNTGAHFLVDRSGRIYSLTPETVLARHTIGLNRLAIGIENVGSGSLTGEQLAANVALVKYLAEKYPIEYLIRHFEYGKFRNSALWEERDKTYFTIKIDPGPAFMKSLRVALNKAGLSLRSAP